MQTNRVWWPVASLAICVLAVTLAADAGKTGNPPPSPAIVLPGTPPFTVDSAVSVANCASSCHNSASFAVTIVPDWRGSMMANSARDPVFYADMAIANKDRPSWTPGEYCIRCHSPMGWLVGHSEDFTGQSLVGTDLDGVQCDYCHRAGDPLNPDSLMSPSPAPVPGHGNGMHMTQAHSTPRRAQYAYTDGTFTPPHEAMQSAFTQSSELCGTCHDVSNPARLSQPDRNSLQPYQYAPIERTYSEWALSWYAQRGSAGTCQSCHMQTEQGHACRYANAPYRTDLGKHDLTGGNSFVPAILPDFWTGLDTASLTAGRLRAVATLQSAAELDCNAYRSGDSVIALVKIVNLTGHKLPTGYPDGRRMWINIVATDKNGDTVFQSGAYDTSTGALTHDLHLKIYQTIHGLTDSTASTIGAPAGASFHFILNDTILSDNRIPPKGFMNAAFAQRLAQPIGASYADSQYWDDTKYVLPLSAANVSVNLMYQSISKEYINFLDSLNVGNSYDWNNWGHRLESSWNVHGKSTPVAMNTVTVPVDTALSVHPKKSLPEHFALAQNYPNPFNPTTTIAYTLSTVSRISLRVYDVLGREVAVLVDEVKPPGSYSVQWNAANEPSGIFFYKFQAGSFVSVRKMLLIR